MPSNLPAQDLAVNETPGRSIRLTTAGLIRRRRFLFIDTLHDTTSHIGTMNGAGKGEWKRANGQAGLSARSKSRLSVGRFMERFAAPNHPMERRRRTAALQKLAHMPTGLCRPSGFGVRLSSA